MALNLAKTVIRLPEGAARENLLLGKSPSYGLGEGDFVRASHLLDEHMQNTLLTQGYCP